MSGDRQTMHTTKWRIKDLTVCYGTLTALHCKDAAFEGNIIAVLGHNGAGKSTFIKTVLNLLPSQEGTIHVEGVKDGRSVLLTPEQHMAFCPETGSVFADISVESYIKLWCRVKQGDAHYYKKKGSRYIELLNIAVLMKKLGRQLSKGQRRRVQTAIGFLTDPQLFLFDEPFDGLDVQKTNELVEIIEEERFKRSFVISSHRMDVIERLADRLLVLKEGTVLSFGPVDKVCRDLCRESVVIRRTSDTDGLLVRLREAYPDALVHRLGEQISVSGENLTLDTLARFVHEFDRNGAQIEAVRPSLVDAMNYHLRSLA